MVVFFSLSFTEAGNRSIKTSLLLQPHGTGGGLNSGRQLYLSLWFFDDSSSRRLSGVYAWRMVSYYIQKKKQPELTPFGRGDKLVISFARHLFPFQVDVEYQAVGQTRQICGTNLYMQKSDHHLP